MGLSWGSAQEPPIQTWVGTGLPDDNGATGSAQRTNVGEPFGVEVGPDGALYVCEVRNHRIRRVDANTHQVTTVAGNGSCGYAGDGGLATDAQLNEPYEVRFDTRGETMYFVEMQNHVVRQVDLATGRISTVVGMGEAGFQGDGGAARQAKLRQPHSIALDAHGQLYIADIGNHRIRRVNLAKGVIDTLAGNGETKLPEAGDAAVQSPVWGPRALAVAGDKLWIALREGHSIWTLDLKQPQWVHVAGDGTAGYVDGAAASARFNGPKGIAVHADGRVFIVDTENHAIRVYDPATQRISTLAGTGQPGASGDQGPARLATLNRPHGIGIGPDHSLYIGDTSNHRVRRIGLGARSEAP